MSNARVGEIMCRATFRQSLNEGSESIHNFLKDNVRRTIDFLQTDQNRGIDPPPVEKPFAKDATRIDLVPHGV